MITKDGLVKIVDFGIAKLLGVTGRTQTGEMLGTVSYMSPEQLAGEDADQQSDVWSLGAVLYEMLTGQRPFRGESNWAVIGAISTGEPKPPSSLRFRRETSLMHYQLPVAFADGILRKKTPMQGISFQSAGLSRQER